MIFINTSSKCLYCFRLELIRNTLMGALGNQRLRCHYHRKRLNQWPDYSIYKNIPEKKGKKANRIEIKNG